ncbi:hypothetical protein A6X21_10455 [Planctopirus hydrillae]|uniref:Uncharacterized protein n=1 Tax=Planctopirus hydrillae TaxID=1841610 RepID=A0A1C3E6Q0_9PLAN|nr:hypothetical protein A6X21_10455 [Planctopirus hydrillae]
MRNRWENEINLRQISRPAAKMTDLVQQNVRESADFAKSSSEETHQCEISSDFPAIYADRWQEVFV